MNPDRFEDPGLKTALKRIYGAERAPAELRERLMRSLAEASPLSPLSQSTIFTDRPIQPPPIRQHFWSFPSFRAAAAVFLVALAGLTWFAVNTSASPIQQDALLAMIQTHDHCCGDEHQDDHQLPGVPTTDLALVGRTLGKELNQPVWVPDLSEEGWQLASAAICTVGAKKSSHLIYQKGQNKLSVFSMSGQGCSSKDGACGRELQSHVIAGLARGGSVHCVVGYCPEGKIKQEDVNKILRDHESELVVASATEPEIGLVP